MESLVVLGNHVAQGEEPHKSGKRAFGPGRFFSREGGIDIRGSAREKGGALVNRFLEGEERLAQPLLSEELLSLLIGEPGGIGLARRESLGPRLLYDPRLRRASGFGLFCGLLGRYGRKTEDENKGENERTPEQSSEISFVRQGN
jgi:hypothetical protein